MPHRLYSPAERREAVARVLAGESRARVSQSLGISKTCVSRWVTEHYAIEAGRSSGGGGSSAALRVSSSLPARVEPLVTVWEAETRLAARKIHYLLERVDDDAIPIHDRPRLHDVARAAEVAHNAHLDHRDGRKGAEVHVDARSVTLQPLAHLTLDELRSLASGGPMPAALVADRVALPVQEAPLPTPPGSPRLPPTPQVDRDADRAVGPPNRRSTADQHDTTGEAKDIAADLSLDILQPLAEGARDGGRSEEAIALRAAKRERRRKERGRERE